MQLVEEAGGTSADQRRPRAHADEVVTLGPGSSIMGSSDAISCA